MKKKSTFVSFCISIIFIMSMLLSACGGATETLVQTDGAEQPQDVAAPAASADATTADAGTALAEINLAEDQTFTFSIRSEPGTLDPWVNNSGEVSTIIAAINEPMLRRPAPGVTDQQWVPGLMTDFNANETNTVFTMKLREGAKWQDGSPITVDDILYSYQRALDSNLGSEIAYRYYPIKNAEALYLQEVAFEELGVKALDQNTIEITTDEPCDFFLDMMTAPGFAPIQKVAAETHGELYGTEIDKVVASGPFKITDWVHKNAITLEKNENYWDAENVKLNKIEITITNDANTIDGMFQIGELSIRRVPNDLVDQFKDMAGFQTVARLKVTFIEFNPKNEFLANKNIRQALSIAFDRKTFAENVMKNPKLAAYGLVPFGVIGLDGGDFREQAGNIVSDASDAASIAEAQALLKTGLEEIGKTVEDLQNGFSIQCLESGKVQAQVIQAMWKENLNVEMPVSVLDFNVILPMLMNGTFDCVIGGGQDSDYRDPQGFMQFIYNENKWDSAEFKGLVEKAHQQTGNDRVQTWMDIEKLVLENFIYIPQVYAENHWVTQDNVQGIEIFPSGYEIDFKNVYITQ